MRPAACILLFCYFCCARAAHATLVPSATGSRQHVTTSQPLGSSLQPVAFGQTDLNTTGGTPGVATRAGLYQISGTLTTTNDATFFDGGPLRGAVFVNGENRGDFAGALTPDGTDQVSFSVLTQLNPGDQIEVRAGAPGATQLVPLGTASHLQITGFSTINGAPGAAATRQHLISSQTLSGSAQPIVFGETDLNTTGGAPSIATRAGLYRITGAMLTTTDATFPPDSGVLFGSILVNGTKRGDFFGGLTPGANNRTTFSLLTQLQPGDQVEVRAASNLPVTTQVLASGSATNLQITSYATVDGLPAVSAARQHVTAEQFLGNTPQTITFGQTDLTTLGAVPTLAAQAGLYEITGTLTTFNPDRSFTPGVLSGQILINGIDRGDFAGTLTPGGIDQTTFSLLAQLNRGDLIEIQASANTTTATEVLNAGSGSNLEIIRYNDVPEPGAAAAIAFGGATLFLLGHRIRRAPPGGPRNFSARGAAAAAAAAAVAAGLPPFRLASA